MPEVAFLALHFEADAEGAQRWSDALLDAGALAVDIADASAGTSAESPLYGEPGDPSGAVPAWTRNRVLALFSQDVPARAMAETLAAELGLPKVVGWAEQQVDDQDWVRLTQAQFGPQHVSPRLWVIPSWSEPVDETAINIMLDPGLAFGTGSHPTTRLCLRWLDAHLSPGDAVLDYGCGSGLLAIAGALLGAAPVHGVDIDPQAVHAATENALRNEVAAEFFLPDVLPSRSYDVVVANILTKPLCALAPLLCEQTASGRALLLSGILREQADEVIAAYAPWITLQTWREEDGWVALAGVKPLGAAEKSQAGASQGPERMQSANRGHPLPPKGGGGKVQP